MKIKPLNWVDKSEGKNFSFIAITPFCIYGVYKFHHVNSWYWCDDRISFPCENLETGKASVENDWQEKLKKVIDITD